MKIQIEESVRKLMEMLENNGFQAFIVGGALRDALLEKPLKDYDIATDALPEDIEDLFRAYRTLAVGKKFGTVIVVTDAGNVEITTFRSDGLYSDGRRPDTVCFSRVLSEDLKRRDFTINAMAWSEKTDLVDLFGGRLDLEDRIIQTVGDPRERFREDYLRMLRGIRFACKLGFELSRETFLAICELSDRITEISAERIREELFQIILSDHPDYGFRLLMETGLLELIFPEFLSTYSEKERDELLCLLLQAEKDLFLRLSVLCRPSFAREFLSSLKCSRFEVSTVSSILNCEIERPMGRSALKMLLNQEGRQISEYAIRLHGLRSYDPEYADRLLHEIQDIIGSKEPYQVKDLKLNGSDLKALGLKQGQEIGELLEWLLEKIIEDPTLNTKDDLEKLAAAYWLRKKHGV